MNTSLKRSLSSSSMPCMISRLDYLDSTMKYLEDRKSSSARWSCSDGAGALGVMNTNCVPLDLAVKEAQSKGSLFDRITFLEDRLIQLCSDMEYEEGSPSRNSQSATSPRTPRKMFSQSFSRFRLFHRSPKHKQPMSPVSMDNFSVTEDYERNGKPEQNRKSNKDERASPKQNNLFHLRLLGCS